MSSAGLQGLALTMSHASACSYAGAGAAAAADQWALELDEEGEAWEEAVSGARLHAWSSRGRVGAQHRWAEEAASALPGVGMYADWHAYKPHSMPLVAPGPLGHRASNRPTQPHHVSHPEICCTQLGAALHMCITPPPYIHTACLCHLITYTISALTTTLCCTVLQASRLL